MATRLETAVLRNIKHRTTNYSFPGDPGDEEDGISPDYVGLNKYSGPVDPDSDISPDAEIWVGSIKTPITLRSGRTVPSGWYVIEYGDIHERMRGGPYKSHQEAVKHARTFISGRTQMNELIKRIIKEEVAAVFKRGRYKNYGKSVKESRSRRSKVTQLDSNGGARR